MGIRTHQETYDFECDGCDDVIVLNEKSLVDATAEARTQGWGSLHRPGQIQEWYCAHCAIKMGAQ